MWIFTNIFSLQLNVSQPTTQPLERRNCLLKIPTRNYPGLLQDLRGFWIMGRRKSKRKPPPKRKNIQSLQKQFNCPFCNHERSCDVILDKLRKVGRIICRVCQESYQTAIISLSEPIDVYNDWIDACEETN